MAKFPIYEQQTVPGAVRASGQEFGAGVAQAQAQLGGVVADIGLQKLSREYTLNRIDDQESLIGWAQESYTAINDTEDISRPETLAKYSAGLKEKAAEIVKNHRGNSESRFQLEAQVNNLVAQYTKSAMGDQIKAQSAKVARVVDRDANELAITAATAPHMIGEIFTEMDRRIDGMKNAIPAGQEQQYRDGAKTRMVTNALYSLEASNRIDEMDAMMNNPNVNKYIDPDSSRRFGIGIAVARGKQVEEARRVEREVQGWTTRLKRDLTPEEVIKVKSLPAKKSEMTPSDKIVEYELVTGKPATQAVIDEMFDVGASGGASGMFGNSLQGRALSFVTENSVAYANGMLPPDQARRYEASMAEAYKPVERVNPSTGLVEKFAPTIPNFVRQSAEQGSRYYGGGSLTSGASQGAAMPGQRIQYTDPSGRVIGQTTVGPDGNWTIQDTNAPQEQGGGMTTSTQGSTPQTRTIWQRRKNIVGPVASARSAIQSIPGVGPSAAGLVFDEAETRQADEDRAYVENTSRDLVRILQNNPKFAEGERKAIEKEISIGPEFFKSVESYEAKLMGVNQSLQDRMTDAQRTLQSNVSIEERKRAMDNINAIENFRQKLGLPVPVKTEEDVKILPPGALYITPKGEEFTRR